MTTDAERARALVEIWRDFLEANPDDLTSPEDLPDHALITFDQFAGMVDAFANPTPGGEEDDSFAILSGAAGESSGLKGFALPPEGYEAVIGDRGEDTGYRREIATGEIVTLADEYDEEDAAILSAPRAVDGEVTQADQLDRSPAQFFFEVGYGVCWAEAFVRNAGTPPFADAIVERAWDIAREVHDDPEEFDRYLAAANSPLPAALSTASPGRVGEEAGPNTVVTETIAMVMPSLKAARDALAHLAATIPDCVAEQLPLAASYAATEVSRLDAAIMLLSPTPIGEQKS